MPKPRRLYEVYKEELIKKSGISYNSGPKDRKLMKALEVMCELIEDSIRGSVKPKHQ